MKRILLVEDNVAFPKSHIELFQSNGHAVPTAVNERESLKMAMNVNPDFIVSDISMVEIDGYENPDILRRDESTSF